jgi:hypothetical protein
MPNQLSDRRHKFTMPRLGILFCALAAGGGLMMVSGFHHGWLAHFGISEDRADFLLGILTGMSFAAGAVSFLVAKYGNRAVQNQIDEFQTQQRRMLIAITTLVTGFGAMVIMQPFHNAANMELDFSIEFALLAVASAAVATFGVGFLRRRYRLAANDELVRALRARATQIGYILAMTGLSAAYLLDLTRSDLMIVALPAVLLIGVVAPSLYFLVAERNANVDG